MERASRQTERATSRRSSHEAWPRAAPVRSAPSATCCAMCSAPTRPPRPGELRPPPVTSLPPSAQRLANRGRRHGRGCGLLGAATAQVNQQVCAPGVRLPLGALRTHSPHKQHTTHSAGVPPDGSPRRSGAARAQWAPWSSKSRGSEDPGEPAARFADAQAVHGDVFSLPRTTAFRSGENVDMSYHARQAGGASVAAWSVCPSVHPSFLLGLDQRKTSHPNLIIWF